MAHEMFTFDPKFTEAVFEYCRSRLSLDPTPLDFGGLMDVHPAAVEGLLGDEGHDPQTVLGVFADHLAPGVVSIDSPGFLAFIPNAPTKNSLLFDMVVACSGLNGTSWLESSGVVIAENQALEFLARRAGMPENSGGAFVSGGSIGNLSALTVARDIGRERHPDVEPHKVRVAISDDAHSSIGKALHVLGIEPLLVTSDDHRFTREGLEAALAADPHPETVVAIAATAGTTNAGIIDDLEGLGSYAREHGLWFHVDGAYGGAAIFSPSHRERFSGLRHVDSFIVDPHKWLLAPLDSCALIYREPKIAKRFLAQQAGYLDVLHQEDEGRFEWNPSDYAIQLSRRPRGLPFWFSVATYGAAAYETAVERGIELAQYTEKVIGEYPYLELVRPASLSVVLYRRRGWGPDDYERWSEQLLRDQIAFVTPTKWEGETVGRICFLNPNTTEELVREILDSMAD